MIPKILRVIFIIVIIIIFIAGFSASYKAHTIDNIVHVVAIGIDKCNDEQNNMKVSFQFVNMSSSKDSSSGDASTVVTSITSNTINKAINLMNSYIGKELNFSHCKVIVFSEDFAKEGISTEICTLVNDEEIRPSTNIVISTSDANTYLKNSNPNIEKLVTNYYDTFELTSNFTGYSDDTTIGRFYTKLFDESASNTAILGRTFKNTSDSQNSSKNDDQGSSKENSQSKNENNSDSTSQEKNQENSKNSSQSENKDSDQNTSGNTEQNNSSGTSLDISGQRGTQNVGIAVFKDAKYIGQLSEMDSICHLLITNNVESFIISVPIKDSPNNLLDLDVSRAQNSKIKVDTSTDTPKISISVHCEGKVLTADKNSNYSDSEILTSISKEAANFLKQNIESYLDKTSKKFQADITGFSNHALPNFITKKDWEDYNWVSKYGKANFDIKVDFNITSSLLFSGN